VREWKKRCTVDVFFDAVACVKEITVDSGFTAWFGTLSVVCTAKQAEKLLERDTLIKFGDDSGGSVRLFPRASEPADATGYGSVSFYLVGTSPLFDLRASSERRLLA
jgi:hypothetical protein